MHDSWSNDRHDRDGLAAVRADIRASAISRLFTATLEVQATRSLVPSPVLKERLSGICAELDDIIREVRSAVPIRQGMTVRIDRPLSTSR